MNDLFTDMKQQMEPDKQLIDRLMKKIEAEKMIRYSPKAPTTVRKTRTVAALLTVALVITAMGIAVYTQRERLPFVSEPSNSTVDNVASVSEGNRQPTDTQTVLQTVHAQDNHNATVPAITQQEDAAMLIPKWEEKTNGEKYTSLSLNQFEYISAANAENPSALDRYLGEYTASGYDIYTEQTYQTTCSVYSLRNISESCAVAVVFPGESVYYPYLNDDYTPETLGQFVRDLDLLQQATIGDAWYTVCENDTETTYHYTLSAYEPLLELLLTGNDSAINIKDSYGFRYMLHVSIGVPVIGEGNLALGLSEDGYLQTNLLHTAKTFYVGESKIAEVASWLEQNHTSKELISSYSLVDNDNEVPKVTTAYSLPAIPEVTYITD